MRVRASTDAVLVSLSVHQLRRHRQGCPGDPASSSCPGLSPATTFFEASRRARRDGRERVGPSGRCDRAAAQKSRIVGRVGRRRNPRFWDPSCKLLRSSLSASRNGAGAAVSILRTSRGVTFAANSPRTRRGSGWPGAPVASVGGHRHQHHDTMARNRNVVNAISIVRICAFLEFSTVRLPSSRTRASHFRFSPTVTSLNVYIAATFHQRRAISSKVRV